MNEPTTSGSTHTRRGPASPFARARRKRDIDELMDHYVSWRETCATVAAAYHSWRTAEREDRNLAFRIYSTALDREEQAASAYQVAVARVAAG